MRKFRKFFFHFISFYFYGQHITAYLKAAQSVFHFLLISFHRNDYTSQDQFNSLGRNGQRKIHMLWTVVVEYQHLDGNDDDGLEFNASDGGP